MAIIQFPGTDFHNLNLDWVLQQVKNLLTEWASTKEEWETLKGSNEAFVSFITAQWDDFKTYVENYLANLPLTEEVSAKIDEMVNNGTLLELITHDEGEGSALSDVAAQWLNTHITQETGYVIDDSLTVQGAAADAKATGDAITDMKSALSPVTNGIIPIPGTWAVGAIYQNTGIPRPEIKYRIMTPNIVNIDSSNAGRYYVNGGFKLLSWLFVNGELSGSVVVHDSFIDLTSGESYRFEIRRINENSSEVLTQTSEFLYNVAKLTTISYNRIKNNTPNLANGNYTANGGTLNGNTVTVTQGYQGILCNDFIPETTKIRIIVKPVFNVPRLIIRLQYFTTSWQTVSIQDAVNNTDNEILLSLVPYVGSQYRILLQNASITAGETNTITIEKLIVNNVYDSQGYSYYDDNFEQMLSKIFDGIDRDKIYTCLKDGSGDFDNFVEAVTTLTQKDGAHLFLGAGEWNVFSEFGYVYMGAVSSNPATWGLVLKNNIHIVGSSKSVIKCVNDFTDTHLTEAQHNAIKTYFSVFNAGQKGFTIENLTINDEGIRYTVHDDLGNAGNVPYTNRYINCSMNHKDGQYPDCIGAGIGEDGYIEIIGCYFDGDAERTRYVYYHGNNNGNVTNAKARIIVKDNYFAKTGTFMLTNYGYSVAPSGIAYVSNNSFGSEPVVTDGSNVQEPNNMVMIKWNNEVRT